jgi:hypothetical protein
MEGASLEATMLTFRAVIAIGCLNWKEWAPEKEDEIPKMQRQFAYNEYAKAIAGLRKSVAEGSCDLRTKMISCILFATFGMYPRIEHYNHSFRGLTAMMNIHLAHQKVRQVANLFIQKRVMVITRQRIASYFRELPC